MRNYIIVGCDVSDRFASLQWAYNLGGPSKRSFVNDEEGRLRMIEFLHGRAHEAGGAEVVLAYEAGVHGPGLHDALRAHGIRCEILAPTKMPVSVKARKMKTDDEDALRIFEVLRGHLMAGNRLPAIWVPPPAVREDREVVRARLDVARKARCVRTQIRMLLKRAEVRRPRDFKKAWSAKHLAWLRGLRGGTSPLGRGSRVALDSLLRQLVWLDDETTRLDQAVVSLAKSTAWAVPARALQEEAGVGFLTAMVFLTEIGDLNRFRNRRTIAAYLGLTPSSHETGNADDRKGHITRQGSARVRWALCQAAWSRVRNDSREKAFYERLVRKHPKKKKIAIVAVMRRLAIRLWHRGQEGDRRVATTAAVA